MNLNKRIIQGLSLACVLLLLTVYAVFGQQNDDNTNASILEPGTAGITNAMKFDEDELSKVDVEILDSEQVTSPEGTEDEESESVLDEKPDEHFMSSAATQKVDPIWENQIMVTVKDVGLNVRAAGSMEAEIIGKMFEGSAATIITQAGEWLKVQSGDVVGYIHRDYCAFGADAQKLAEEQGAYYAVSTTNGLRVRKTPSLDGEICTIIDAESQLKVKSDAEKVEGWVAVEYNGGTAYVSAEFVSVELVVGKAISMEDYMEEMAQKQAEEEAAKREQASQQAASLGATQDEVTLLAALIFCEAGNQPYEGKVAVGAVVMNRVKSSKYPNNMYDVIYHPGQFAPVYNGYLAQILSNPSKINEGCYQAAKEALSGVDNVNGALYFNNVRCGRSGLVIGDHVFW